MTQTREEDAVDVPSSPEDGGNFKRGLQIDMKGLVGDAVGNMSISPGNRDVVLAARKGLFIIDLEAPLNVPRFLPQGGTWDVADVQWNPHISRQEYIVSTSSEKLLIWNLYLSGKTSIEHILRSHYRAITDINWHNSDPDVVVSTGIDSWLWAWDLRTPQKAVMGLCAFNAGGTQVKWSRQDDNILASSHANEVLIWDRRKGSLPVSRLQAHSAKIYGIDWSHNRRNELVTCSLDKTIKVWDIQKPLNHEGQYQPTMTINTAYPVWRARDLPFGHGVLSLPQRGETALEMYAADKPLAPVERFEGHLDVVKEFVWRRGENAAQFQLITWSKDRTLRFWPIDSEVMDKVGTASTPATPAIPPAHSPFDELVSFSNRPIAPDLPPALSAPIGHRAILAEVRAAQPFRPTKPSALHTVTRSSSKTPAAGVTFEAGVAGTPEASGSGSKEGERPAAGKMSRGYVGGRSAHITTLAWLSSVKVGHKRDDSSGPASGGESGTTSRLQSRSRPPSISREPGTSRLTVEGRSESRERERDKDRERGEDERDVDSNQSLQEEITSVMSKLISFKVKLEKADLTKRRTCTFGLHGPWGESTSVFIRVSFTFPRDYPQATHPRGTPQLDLERNPLIAVKTRVQILRRLRAIRETERPCLEACLRFLLFGSEHEGEEDEVDSESSDEDDETQPLVRKGKEGTFSFARGDKNLAEPRTSQGVFGPNGELVCFFRAPPRIVRNTLRELSASPSRVPTTPSAATNNDQNHNGAYSHGQDNSSIEAPRLFWSPALLSDAVRRLALSAHDREVEALDARGRAEDAHSILRIMSNLFTFPHQSLSAASTGTAMAFGGNGIGMGGMAAGTKARRVSEHSRPEEATNYSLLTPRSTVYIKDAAAVTGTDVLAAREYVFPGSLSVSEHGVQRYRRGRGMEVEAYKANMEAARKLGRTDHERVFGMLQVLLTDVQKVPGAMGQERSVSAPCNPLTLKIIENLYTELCLSKDIQMLAMMSVVLLRLAAELRNPSPYSDGATTPNSARPHQDYFNFKRNSINGAPMGIGMRQSPRSPMWTRTTPSPGGGPPSAPPLTSPSSSRGSWSSLFNASNMRRFISTSSRNNTGLRGYYVNTNSPQPPSPQVREFRHNSVSSTVAPVTRSWSEATDPAGTRNSVSFGSAGHGPGHGHTQGNTRRPTFSQIVSSSIGTGSGVGEETKRIVVEVAPQMRLARSIFRLAPRQRRQLEAHIWAYAEMLLAWCLPQKRAELLEAARGEFAGARIGAQGMTMQLSMPADRQVHPIIASMLNSSPLGVVRSCASCGQEVKEGSECGTCGARQSAARCAVCRLPIKGLSHTCMQCLHVSHIRCWKERRDSWCATGCGCGCVAVSGGVGDSSSSLDGEGIVEVVDSPVAMAVNPYIPLL